MKDVKLNLSGAPGGVEEVLVVLQGVHQPIPVGPVAEDATTKALPPPPSESGAAGKQGAVSQTEADKVVQKYDQIGKEQNHVYGALASGLPNFNAKPPANAPATPAPAPKATSPATTPPAKATPVLPLGAPRPKSERPAPPPQ
jgi:rod shape-determining protein MreC